MNTLIWLFSLLLASPNVVIISNGSNEFIEPNIELNMRECFKQMNIDKDIFKIKCI